MRRLAGWMVLLTALSMATIGGFRAIQAHYRPIADQAACLKEIDPALRGGIRCERLAAGVVVKQRFLGQHDRLAALRVQTQAQGSRRPLDRGDCFWSLARVRDDGTIREIRRGTWKTAESPDHGFVTISFDPVPESQGHRFELRIWSEAPEKKSAGLMMCRLDRPGETLVTTAERPNGEPPAERIETDAALNLVYLYQVRRL